MSNENSSNSWMDSPDSFSSADSQQTSTSKNTYPIPPIQRITPLKDLKTEPSAPAEQAPVSEPEPPKAPDPVPAPEADPMTEEEQDHSYTPAPSFEPAKPQKKGSPAVIILSIILGILILALGALVFLFVSNGGNIDGIFSFIEKDSGYTQPPQPEDEPEEIPAVSDTETTSPPETTEAPVTEKKLELYSYLGYWHRSGDSSERELSIHSAEDSKVVFDLWYRNMFALNNVTAYVDKNTADFYYSYGYTLISGTLYFDEGAVTVEIASSNHNFMPVETMIFNGRHHESWAQAAAVDIPVVPNHISAPSYYVETPFVMYVRVIEGLNLRIDPSTVNDRIRLLPINSMVTVHGWNHDYTWAFVYDNEADQYGWVAYEYLSSEFTY